MAISETARLVASLELKDLFSKQVDSASKSLGHLDKSLDHTQSRAYRAGQQIGHGIQNAAKLIATAAISAATISAGVFALAIKKASDLNESVNKVGVVFRDQGARILAFGKTAAEGLGLSEQAADEAAASFGNLFVSMGLSSKTSATMSIAMVKLAGDLASFNNIDPTEALDKLRSGLTGQFRPLKELGINIDQTLLKAEALKIGLVKSTVPAAQVQLATLKVHDATVKLTEAQRKYGAGSEQVLKATVAQQKAQEALSKLISKVPSTLTPAQKAQAAYALILEQSKTAQGDFARTSGGLANQVRILKANFDDLLGTLGEAALPGVAKIFVRINAAIKQNQPAVKRLGDAIAGLFSDANINQGAAFIENALKTAMAAAPILVEAGKATLFFIQQAVGIFNTLPDPLKAIVVGGFALNKLTGGLVTNIGGALIDLVGKSRGASPANPVFVSDISGGLGGAAGAAEGGILGKGLGLIPAVALGSLIVAAAVPIGKAFADALPPFLKGSDGSGKSQSQIAREAADAAVAASQSKPLAVTILDRGGRETGTAPGKLKDDLVSLANLQRSTLDFIHQQFREAFAQLRHATTGAEIKAAIAGINKQIFGKGVGGSGGAAATEKTLRQLLSHTDNQKLREAITAEIKKVHAKVLGRQFEEAEFRKFDKVWKSSEGNARKIADLQKIAKDVGAKDRANGAKLQAKVDALKAGLKSSISQTTQAIKDKDLSVKVTNTISNQVVVNSRTVIGLHNTYTRYYQVGHVATR